MMFGPVSGIPGNAPNVRHYHTISHRGLPPGPSGLPHPITHHHLGLPSPHPQMMHTSHMPMAMQVPIMMPQQFATLQPSRSAKKKKKDKKSNGIPVGMPIVPPLYAYHQPPPPQSIIAQSLISDQRPLAMSNRKLAASVGNGLDDSGNSGAESPGGTGIYRRKGHLNERAFSYSIRQEHRSRSHGSLSSLQFNPPDMKKEREIAQMVAGIDLNDADDHQLDTTLQRKQASTPHGYQHHHQHQAIYGNSNLVGNGMGPSSNFGKPRR